MPWKKKDYLKVKLHKKVSFLPALMEEKKAKENNTKEWAIMK
jgi:hypothetical protein